MLVSIISILRRRSGFGWRLAATMVCISALNSISSADQYIVPARLYNDLGRPIQVRLRAYSVPFWNTAWTLRLIEPLTHKVVAQATALPGTFDLSKLFPMLRQAKHPSVLYVQPVIEGRERGAPLVLQPMTDPGIVRLAKDGKSAQFLPATQPSFAGYRAWVDQDIVFRTSLGNMVFRTRPDCAPNTVYFVLGFVRGGLYDGTIWHRVVKFARGYPFVIQGGDPMGTGDGGPGFSYALENSKLQHRFGVISIARDTDPNTNGCQIFVCLSRRGTARLDHEYPAFGEAISGAKTIVRIADVPVGKADRPIHPPVIERAYLEDAQPFDKRSQPRPRPRGAFSD